VAIGKTLSLKVEGEQLFYPFFLKGCLWTDTADVVECGYDATGDAEP
jgi:hypothetical protein